MSHAEFLRDAWTDAEQTVITLVRALTAAGTEAAQRPLADGLAHTIAVIDALPGLLPGDREILAYTARLVLAPRTMRAAHLAPLRQAGLSDDEIHDVAHVVCCFSYMNRLADGLGVIQSDPRQAWAVALLGQDALDAHIAWGAGQ